MVTFIIHIGLNMFTPLGKVSNENIVSYVELIAYLAELKEWDNRKHLARIRGYVKLLGSALNLSKRDIEITSVASMLHDVGKAVIAEELLLRKGEYSFEEWQIMEKHTLNCQRIIGENDSIFLQTGVTIAKTHHERWDGSGYPLGLSGENIPFCGRICAVADVFDALVTERQYKETISDEDAIRVIEQSSGSLFDPLVIQAFVKRIDDILLVKSNAKTADFIN